MITLIRSLGGIYFLLASCYSYQSIISVYVYVFVHRNQWIHWYPINPKMEFRIIHNIFCEQYHFQRNAFAFDDYMRRCWEKYLLTLISIPPSSKNCFCILSFTSTINYIAFFFLKRLGALYNSSSFKFRKVLKSLLILSSFLLFSFQMCSLTHFP